MKSFLLSLLRVILLFIICLFLHSIFFRTNASVYAENETITFTKKGQTITVYIPEEYAQGNIKVMNLESRLEVVGKYKGTKTTKQGRVVIKWKEDGKESGQGVTGFMITSSDEKTFHYTKTVTANLHIYKLTVRYNGGKDNDGKEERTVWEGGYSNCYKIPSNTVKVVNGLNYKEVTVTRDGYKFLGWSTNKDDTKPNLKEGDSLSVSDIEEIIYAVWEKEGSSSDNSGNSSAERKTPTYAEDEKTVEVGHYITMKKGSAWNVYSDKECVNNVNKDNVKYGVVYEVTYVAPNRVGLNINGTTRYIIWSTDSTRAQAHFKQVAKPADEQQSEGASTGDAYNSGTVPENSSSSGLSSLNFEGILGKVFEIITKVVKFLIEKVFNPYIKPLEGSLISGLTQ